jgi:hypothetical protein
MPNPSIDRRAIRCAVAVLAALALVGPTQAATIVDPAGDSTSQDIVSVTGVYDAHALHLSASFVSGTLDPAALGFTFGLDTDEDPGTGLACSDDGFAFPCGAEWSLFFQVDYDPANAILVDSDTGTMHASLPVVFGIDTLSLTVPLDADPALGLPDDGRLLFGLIVGDPTPGFGFEGRDLAADSALGGALVGPSTPVPEPATGALVGLGLMAMSVARRGPSTAGTPDRMTAA